MELCLFDSPDALRESERITLPEKTAKVWHGYLPEAKRGQGYGYRVHGPSDPAFGQWRLRRLLCAGRFLNPQGQ